MQNVSSQAQNDPGGTGAEHAENSLRLTEFSCIMGAYFFFRLPWLFMLPMSEAPDEFAHYWVIKFLKENLRLPSASEVFAGGPSAVYGSLPQLGYIPHVLAAYMGPADSLTLLERVGSILMGLFMLYASYNLGVLLFPKYKLAALALPAAIICHPQLVFIQSYANNDSTSSAIASLLILFGLETLHRGIDFRKTILIGALSGWLAITKYSGLAVLPVVALAVLCSLFFEPVSIGLALGSLVAATLIALLVSGWWFFQNNIQYPGDFMGTRTMYKTWAQTFNRELNPESNSAFSLSHIIKDHRWWRMSFFSYWGLFGYMNKYLWRPLYFIWGAFSILPILGAISKLVVLKNTKSSAGKLLKDDARKILCWVFLTLVLVINIASMIWASTKNLGGPQGRYLVTSELPVMALIIGGTSLLPGRKQVPGARYGLNDICIMAFILFNALVSIGSWIYLFNCYGGWHLNPLQ